MGERKAKTKAAKKPVPKRATKQKDVSPKSPFGTRTYQRALDALPEVENLIKRTKKEFLAIGASFDRSTKHYQEAIEDAIARGVVFKYIVLSKSADLGMYSKQFGQTVEELRSEIEASDAALEKVRKAHPNNLLIIRKKRLSPYRLYAADPNGARVPGIIVLHGNALDTPQLPAYVSDNLKQTDFAVYLRDALSAAERESNPQIFIVHGHNEARRRELKEMLKDRELKPIVLTDEPSHGAETIIDKFERLAQPCEFAIAIFTKDDVVEKDGKKYFQARPNVMYEVGWFAANLGRSRVLLLLEEGTDMFSDLQGVLQLRFTKSLDDCYRSLITQLETAELVSSK